MLVVGALIKCSQTNLRHEKGKIMLMDSNTFSQMKHTSVRMQGNEFETSLWEFEFCGCIIIETSMQITNIVQIELSLNHSQVFKAQILKMTLHSPFGDKNLSYDQKNDKESNVLGPS
jgi:hypothetical protein